LPQVGKTDGGHGRQMPPLPEASERPPHPLLTQMIRLTAKGTGVTAVSSRMTPSERGT